MKEKRHSHTCSMSHCPSRYRGTAIPHYISIDLAIKDEAGGSVCRSTLHAFRWDMSLSLFGLEIYVEDRWASEFFPSVRHIGVWPVVPWCSGWIHPHFLLTCAFVRFTSRPLSSPCLFLLSLSDCLFAPCGLFRPVLCPPQSVLCRAHKLLTYFPISTALQSAPSLCFPFRFNTISHLGSFLRVKFFCVQIHSPSQTDLQTSQQEIFSNK